MKKTAIIMEVQKYKRIKDYNLKFVPTIFSFLRISYTDKGSSEVSSQYSSEFVSIPYLPTLPYQRYGNLCNMHFSFYKFVEKSPCVNLYQFMVIA